MPANHDDNPTLRTLAEIEADAIRETLIQTFGCATKTAKILGIGRSTLYRKIAEHGLQEAANQARRDRPVQRTKRDRRRPMSSVLSNPPSLTMKERFPPGTFGSPECNAALMAIMSADPQVLVNS